MNDIWVRYRMRTNKRQFWVSAYKMIPLGQEMWWLCYMPEKVARLRCEPNRRIEGHTECGWKSRGTI